MLLGDESPQSRTKALFLDCLSLVERLHRRLLDVIKDRLEAEDRHELNPVQALLLYNIGDHEMTAGELKTRGYYQGSNVSYNLKKLVELGYINHARADHDRRAVRISLTERGQEVHRMIDSLYEEQLAELLEDGLWSVEDLTILRRNLRNLERFWSDRLRFSF
ncbi:MAG: MarR family transcriptional regulator [Alphaproteobacteria bacterium]|nr:MAG: MarR family transcriptional regulator [Alphaproteobacteria bacterium]